MINRIDKYLLDEMINYNPYLSISKAERIYNLCVRQKHYDLARRIYSKYNIQNRRYRDDITMAFELSLMAQKKKSL
jgi:hypothetical protein